MSRQQVIYGFLIGCIAPLIVVLLFVIFMIDSNIAEGIRALKFKGQLANVLRIGLLANLVLFMLFVRKKELLARGIVMSTLLILVISLIV